MQMLQRRAFMFCAIIAQKHKQNDVRGRMPIYDWPRKRNATRLVHQVLVSALPHIPTTPALHSSRTCEQALIIREG